MNELEKKHKSVIDLVTNNKEDYNLYHALKSTWRYDDYIIATTVYCVGDFDGCHELLETYDEYSDRVHGLEESLIDFYVFNNESWKMSDFANCPTIDWDFISKRLNY